MPCSAGCGSLPWIKSSFRKTRKSVSGKSHRSAECGNLLLRKSAFRKMRKSVLGKNRCSAECGSLPRLKSSFRKTRKSSSGKSHRSAECGSLLWRKSVFRKMRKGAGQVFPFPHGAERRPVSFRSAYGRHALSRGTGCLPTARPRRSVCRGSWSRRRPFAGRRG